MQTRRNFVEVLAEPLHDGNRITRDRIIRRPSAEHRQQKRDHNNQASGAATWQQLPNARLCLANGVFYIRSRCAPASPRTTLITVTGLRCHSKYSFTYFH